jgi:hypothetical protein
MLCPVSFSGRNLGPTALNCVKQSLIDSDVNIPDDAFTVLQEIIPEATVLFHELFHLVWTGEDTKPDVGEVYRWTVLLGREYGTDEDGEHFLMDTDLAQENPQTYAFLA